MIGYATRTGTKRNLAGLRECKWGLLISAAGVWRTEGFEIWAADNGQWSERETPGPFKADRFERFLAWIQAQPIPPQWIALPDIVFGELASLALSREWHRKLRRRKAWRDQHFMLVVQDGMEPRHIRRLIGPKCGIFIGGSSEWKESSAKGWGELARERGAILHMGRVNSMRRIQIADEAGAHSFDGRSAAQFGDTLARLDHARRQMSIEGYLARRAA